MNKSYIKLLEEAIETLEEEGSIKKGEAKQIFEWAHQEVREEMGIKYE